jgi:hypothetical protein
MAEVAQYQFTFKEVAELLIKRQGIHEGVWAVGFNLNIGTGLMGPTPDQSFPSAMVQITSAILTKIEAGQQPSPSAVDAAIVNPRSGQPSPDASSGEVPKVRRGRRTLL